MELVAEKFNPQDHYNMICDWWLKSKWPVIPLSHLPRLGIVVSCDGMPAAAGWIYQTDSAFCLFEWIVANPDIRKEKRTASLSKLISQAKIAAIEMGYQSIFITARNQSLISRLKNHGFISSDENMTNLTFNIQGGL